jgi:PAS domain S-box-containing protein
MNHLAPPAATTAAQSAFGCDDLLLALRAAGVAVSSLDLGTGVGVTSPEWADVIGLPPDPDEQTFAAFLDRVHPDDRERVAALHADPQAVAAGLDFEFRVNHPTRGERWIHSRSLAVGGREDGARRLVGIAQDITERKRTEQALRASEARQAFLLKLSDGLRPLNEPSALLDLACRVLGEQLAAARVNYAEVDGEEYVVAREYREDGLPSMVGRYPIASFRSAEREAFEAGRTVAVADILTESSLSAGEAAAYGALGVRAFVSVPLVKAGRLVAALSVIRSRPGAWQPDEVALVEEVAERTWAAMERIRAEDALRESDERQTFLLQLNDALRPLADPAEIERTASRLLVEYVGAHRAIYLEIEGDTASGTAVIRGQYARGVPEFPSRFPFADYAQGFPEALLQSHETIVVHDTAGDARLEESVRAAWLGTDVAAVIAVSLIKQGRMVAAFGLHHAEPRQWTPLEIQLVEAVADRTWAVVERARAEAQLRESEERQAFLLRLSDALRPLADPIAVQDTAARVLGEHLGASRASYAEVEADDAHFLVHRDYTDGVPSYAGRYLLDSFGPGFVADLRAGLTVTLVDAERDSRVGEAERAVLAAGTIRAFIGVPLLKGGRLAAVFSLHHPAPHEWSATEVALVEEIAERTWAAVERARVEAALRESETRFRTFAEYATDTLWIADAASGRLEYISPAFDRMWGESRDAVMADLDRWIALLHPEDRAEGSQGMRRVVTGEVSHLIKEFRIVRPTDGAIRWILDTGFAIHDAAGAVTRVGGIAQDITERKMAEAAMRESEERYRLIVERATDYAIFDADAERRIETWTPGAAAVFGWSAEEAIGQSTTITFVPEDQAAGVPEQEVAAARDEGMVPNVRWHQRKDGSRVFIEGATYARRGPDGAFQGVFKVGQDVTARLLAEEARQEEDAARREEEASLRDELAAQVAAAAAEARALTRRLLTIQEEERRHLARELHDEIGQVLTGLNFQLAAAAGRGGTAALAEASATVRALTDQVRQLSMDLRPAVLDSFGLLAAVQLHIERFQTQTGIAVHLRHHGVERRFAPDVEIAAYRVVQEALTNVARHAETDLATVQLYADGALTLVIRDSGRGFDPARASRASGLGGMRERVELLGGTLEIEAMAGGGTTVAAEIPLKGSGNERSPDGDAGAAGGVVS